jgi:hypothetical protein
MLAYNIDELKADSTSAAKLLFRLWEIWREAGPDAPLLPEERVVRDAWTYDKANGNGICDILVNERYDEFARSDTEGGHVSSGRLGGRRSSASSSCVRRKR